MPQYRRQAFRGNNTHTSAERYSARRGEQPIPTSQHRERDAIAAQMRERLTEELSIGERPRAYGNPDLPFHRKRDEFVDAVVNNRVTLLGGETGSGKTTEGPLTLAELRGPDNEYYFAKIIVLQPRRMTVDNIATYERKLVADVAGEEAAIAMVGLAHSERVELHDDNRIIFMTPGTYTRMADRIAEVYGDKRIVVMPDEIHESNFQMELAAATVASQLVEHDQWRMVVSSATHDADRVDLALEKVNGGKIPHVLLEGRPHGMEMLEDLDKTAASLYAEIGHRHERSIVFAPGKQEIDDTIEAIQDALGKGMNDVVFRKLHAKMTRDMINHVNDPLPEGKRLVIVATNAAQSGMTFPGVTLVLGDGQVRREELGRENATGTTLSLAARSELTQMAGRGGRDVDGGEFHLVAPLDGVGVPFDSELRADHPLAEIYQTNLARAALSTAGLGKSLEHLNGFAMHKVREDRILEANEALLRLGALDRSYQITGRGVDMDRFSLRPELSRAVVEAWRTKRRLEIIARTAVIASAVNSNGLAYFAHDATTEWKGLLRETTTDDMIAQLDLMMATREYYTGKDIDEARLLEMSIDPKNTYQAHRQLDKALRVMGIKWEDMSLGDTTPDEEQELRDCMASGMVDTVYRRLQSSGRKRGPQYANILNIGTQQVTVRDLSDRSVLEGDPELIAAIPRWYEKFRSPTKREREDGADPKQKIRETHDIVEMGMPVTVGMMATYLMGIATNQNVSPVIRGGKVYEQFERRYGALTLTTGEQPASTALGEKARKELTLYVQKNPPSGLRELREVKRILEGVWQRTPANMQGAWLEHEPLRDQLINQLISEAITEGATSVGEVDNFIRRTIYEQELNVDHWISKPARNKISKLSPTEITIGETTTLVRYHEGQPYITKLPAGITPANLPDELKLPDGRDVLLSANVPGPKRNNMRMTAADYKQAVAEGRVV